MIGIVNAAMVAAGEKNERFRLDSSAATVVSFDYFSSFFTNWTLGAGFKCLDFWVSFFIKKITLC